MTFAGGVSFVTKRDFTANIEGVVATYDQAKVDLATVKGEIASAVAGIPTAITNQIGSTVTQAISQWSSQISSLSDRVTAFSNDIQALEAEMESVHLQIATLENEMVELEAQIEELEESLGESDTSSEDTTTLWTISAYTDREDISVSGVRSSPYRIEEPGDYNITLILTNSTGDAQNVIASVIFTPRRNDRIFVDDSDLYLDSYYSPIRWYGDVEVRSDGTCRRIRFESEIINLPDETERTLEMDFTLDY